jgi:hypothetical protein
VFGQSHEAIQVQLDSFIAEFCKTDYEKFWIQEIVNNRNLVDIYSRLDTTSASIIRIVEVYDSLENEYSVKEEYWANDSLDAMFRNGKEDSTFAKKSDNRRLTEKFQDRILFFGPNDLMIFCGCGQVKRRIYNRCLKKVIKRVKKEGKVSEPFARLITNINRETKQVKFTLEIPKADTRLVHRIY